MERQHGVGLTVVVAKFDFVDVRGKIFDDGADLTAEEIVLWKVFGQGDDIEELELGEGCGHGLLSDDVATDEAGKGFGGANDPGTPDGGGVVVSGEGKFDDVALAVLVLGCGSGFEFGDSLQEDGLEFFGIIGG